MKSIPPPKADTQTRITGEATDAAKTSSGAYYAVFTYYHKNGQTGIDWVVNNNDMYGQNC